MTNILRYQNIATKMNRKLIVNLKKNFLFEYFEDFFYFENHNFIYKQDEIKKIPSFYPSFIASDNYFKLEEKYNLVPKNYDAIQIRNTDYTCDYKKLISKIN